MRRQMRPLGDHVARFTWFAYLILWLEALSIAFWPVPVVIGAFVILALLGIPPALPVILHIAVLLVFAVGLIGFILSGIRRLTPPVRAAALRRVELDSGLRHRPFDTLTDRPIGASEPVMAALWKLHQDRKRAEIARLRLSTPRSDLPERDIRALRLLVFIGVIIGLIIAGPRSGRLIAASLTPNLTASDAPLPLEAWIKPPAYTGLATIVLKTEMEKPISVPVGSTIEAHVTGGSSMPHFNIAGRKENFRALDGGGFSLSSILSASGTAKISRGWSTLGQWKIDIVPDMRPVVAFSEPPAGAESGALKVQYHATDDYGVSGIDLHIRLAEDRPKIFADPIAAPLASGQTDKELSGTSYQDLTAHPWAGMKVLAKLVATDTSGQTAESAELPVTLPERSFTNPAAQTIINARKHVIVRDMPGYQISALIYPLVTQPQLYGENLSVFLALRMAAEELIRANLDDRQSVADIEDLLWNAALKIDGGDSLETEQALRAAEDDLEKALKNPNSTASEIARLTTNLKKALNRHVDAMAQAMRERRARGELPKSTPDPNAKSIDRNDLERQIDEMNDMAQGGSREDAQKMLSYLKDMLENMRAAGMPKAGNEQAKKALEDLKDLARKQRELEKDGTGKSAQDEKAEPGSKDNATEKNSQPNSAQGKNEPEKSTAPSTAKEQEALRQSLGDTARAVGEAVGNIPKAISEADKAMRGAAKALQSGNQKDAEENQENAATQLDQAAQSLGEQMSQNGGAESDENGSENNDPFSRGRASNFPGVKVPTVRDVQRSRAILDELRKRSGEHNRPRPELDYLQRLLQ